MMTKFNRSMATVAAAFMFSGVGAVASAGSASAAAETERAQATAWQVAGPFRTLAGCESTRRDYIVEANMVTTPCNKRANGKWYFRFHR